MKRDKNNKLSRLPGKDMIRSSEVRKLLNSFLEESEEESYTWESLTSPDPLPHNWIYDVFRDSQNRIWVATWGGGVAVCDGKKWKTYTIHDGLLSNSVTSIKEDNNGKIWLATDNGINTIADDNLEIIGLRGKRLLNITFDKQCHLWACCWGTSSGEPGLYEYDGNQWKGYAKSDGVPGREILKVFEDSREYIWVGTYESSLGAGVGCFNGNQWFSYDHDDGLPDNCVYSMFEDPEGNMWFGTVRGIGIFDIHNNKWHKLAKKDGLIDNRVYSMLIDSRNNMWFGTEGGISKLTINPGKKKLTDKLLDKLPGPADLKSFPRHHKKNN